MSVVRDLVLVGSGGFAGAVLRYATSGLAHTIVRGDAFPYGTLAVNVIGCLLIGVLAGLVEARSVLGPETRLFIFIGLLGGFATYSTFGHETLALLRDGETLKAAGNVVLHLVLGLGAVWIGYAFGSTR